MKKQSLLYKARAATAGLQENWADVEIDDETHLSGSSDRNDEKELKEFSEEWRRRKIAWLCKELPAHDPAPMIRILNRQRKWIQQEDVKYIITHLLRIRENNIGHRVYKWLVQQGWFEFDPELASKLADILAKDLKVVRCRDVFDDIINRGYVPCESTFILLIMAYIEAPVKGFVDEACDIYNRMIQLGGYQPSLSLQNSLFKALLHGTGGTAKHHLRPAEAVFQNLKTAGHRIKEDIYEGLIWLHSYQDCIDHERIVCLRNEMKQAGFKESRDLLVSILRVCSRHADVKEAERTWAKLVDTGVGLTSQAYVYQMEVYAKAGQPMKSLEIFTKMQEEGVSMSVIAYLKIIEIMSKAQEKEHAENFMKQFEDSGLKPLQPSYVDLMQMYMCLSMYGEVESTFSRCMAKCRPNRAAYEIYLESLIKCGMLERAEGLFAELQKDGAIGIKSKMCNIMLEGYLNAGQEEKIKQLYDEMCHKKYDVEPTLMLQIKPLLNLGDKDVNKRLSLKLVAEQREILIAIFLSGAKVESYDENKTFEVHFEFNEKLEVQDVLKAHIYDTFYEWLKPVDRLKVQAEDIPPHFSTVSHGSFRFYANQFRPGGQMVMPRLIHRWLSSRVLAYWYMYGGRKSTSGDVIFYAQNYKVEDVECVGKALRMKSINCVIKRKGKQFQIRCQGKDAIWVWELMEPYILDPLKEVLKPKARVIENVAGNEDTDFYSEDEFTEGSSEYMSDSDSQEGIKETETESEILTQ